MRLGILTATWRRPHLTEIMLRHTASLRAEIDDELVLVAVRSPEDPEPFEEVRAWRYIDAPNKPLSRKWTRGMAALRVLDVDAVMILGSDDFVNGAFLDRMTTVLTRHGSDYAQPGGLWIYDAPSRQCVFGVAQRIGAGRTLSRKLLDILDWQPWAHADLGRLDGAMDERVQKHVVVPYRLLEMPQRGQVLVDVKTHAERSDRQAWTFDDLAGLARARYKPEPFWHHYFPSIADDILNLHTQEV